MCHSAPASGTGWHNDQNLMIGCTKKWGHPYSSINSYTDWFRLVNKFYNDVGGAGTG